jgi:hypothetical protein
MESPVTCRISGLDNEENSVILGLKRGISALVCGRTGVERVHFSFPMDVMDSQGEVPICEVNWPGFVNSQKSSLKEEIEALFTEIMKTEVVVRINNH